jgi:type II secretory pathway component PulJ
VATLIFAIVIAAAYALFDSARTMTDRAEFHAQLQQEARVVLDTLRADLQGAYGSGSAYDTGLIGTQGGGDETPLCKLDLVSVNHPTTRSTTPEIDLTRTTYYVNEEPSSETRGLVRKKVKQILFVDQAQREDEGLEEIGPNVLFVKFRYYDGSTWTEVWDSTRSGKLPRAIEVTIHVKGLWHDEEVIEKFDAKIYLPLAAETPEKTQ